MTSDQKIALVGVGAALFGTVLGFVAALVAPWATERMPSKGARDELIMAQRILVYAELLDVGATLVDIR